MSSAIAPEPPAKLPASSPGTAAPWWQQWRANPRMPLIIGASALLAVAAAALMWSRQPDYGVLYTNLSDRDGGAIISSLQQMNIPYKFTAGGGALMVPANKVPEARLKLAQQGLPKGGNVGFELMDNQKFGTSQFAEQINYQRALEGELARSINSIAAVESARVHLALPKPSLFVREQKQPSASVVLALHRGRNIDDAQVSAIVHLIASSVPELNPKSITVVDQAGNLLSAANAGGRGLDVSQLKYVQEIEQSYIRRIEAILQPMLGAANVRAQVTADVDFSVVEKTDETYRPNQEPGGAAIRSQQSSESGQLAGQMAGGVPGALSNQPPLNPSAPLITSPGTALGTAGLSASPGAQAQAGARAAAPVPTEPSGALRSAGGSGGNGGSGGSGRRDATTNYEVDRSIRHVQQSGGGVRRLSVAVLVNYRDGAVANATRAPQALSAPELEQINNLVKEAMGFNRERGDSLSVANSPFASDTPAAGPVLPLWQQPDQVALAKTAGQYLLLALLALFAWFAVLRPLLRKHLASPAAPPALAALPSDTPAAQSSAPTQAPLLERQALRHQENLDYAQHMAGQDPRTVAMLLNQWISTP